MGKKRKRGRLGEDNLVTAPFGAPLTQQASAKEEGDCLIAKKLVAAIKKQVHGKVVNLKDVIDGRAAAAVLEGSVNYRTEAIFLAGLPEVPESRPHSEVNN